MSYRDEFSSDLKDVRWGMGQVVAYIVLPIILISGILGTTVHACNIADQPARIAEKTLDADNVIYNYEWFKSEAQRIKAMDSQISDSSLAADTFDSSAGPREKWDRDDKQESARLHSIVTGLKNERANLVATYNARASMANRSLFKTKDTPAHLE